MSTLARLLATWFYSGYWPKGPGTAGSLAAVLVVWALGLSPQQTLWAALLLLPIAIWSADRLARDMGKKDPQIIVVDEVVGQWIALTGAISFNTRTLIAAFVLFRFFDIVKPPPVRALERIPGGAGIVLDDAMAGIYAALVLVAVQWFNSSSSFFYGSS